MNMHLMLTLADASQVDASAHVGSMLLVGALLMLSIAGALKCIAIATRPEAHTLCALSLAVVLIALAGTAGIALSNHYSPPNSTAKLAVVLVTWFMAAIAWVLAIVGLADYRRRRQQLEQGQVQGWLALALTTAKLVFVGWAIWGGVSRANSRRDASTAHATPIADAAENVIAIPSRLPSADMTERFRSLNFSFTPPNEQWAKLHAQLVRRDATTSYTHGSPKTIFVVVADRVGAERGVTTDKLVELVTTQLVAPGSDVKFGPKQPVTIGGVPGEQFEVTVGAGIYAKKSIYWLAAHGGFAYQLITEGGAGDARLLTERHTEMIAGFALNDPKLVAHVGGVRSVPDFASEHYGYRLDLSRDAWHTWPSGSAEFQAAQFKAAFRNQAAIGVVPVYLPEMETSLDELGAALARTMVQDFDPSLRTEIEASPAGDAEGMTFGYQTEPQPGVQRELRFRILRQDRRAFMIAAWADDPTDDLIAAVDRAMEGFEIQRAFERSNGVGNFEQKAWRGVVLNELGLLALVRRELEVSRACVHQRLIRKKTVHI